MKLEFDSISDLQQFLDWAENFRGKPTAIYHIAGGGGATARGVMTTGVGGGGGEAIIARSATAEELAKLRSAALNSPKIDTGGVAFDTPQQPQDDKAAEGGLAVEAAGKVPEQPATRKRRTKAEIAADEKAAADLAAAKAQGEGTDKAADVPAGSETAPTGANPFEQVAVAGEGPAAGVEWSPPTDAAGDEVVTPFLHLTRAREFIAKHGMPKYNETFAKAGLDPNVMGYNAEQRAQHMAAMAELDKA